MRWGTLERVPHTPQNFSRTNYYWWEPTFVPGSSLRLRSCMAALAIPAAVVPEGGLPFWLPAAPAFSLISSPIPPAPFPAGRGRPKVYFAGGFAPGTPALNRLRHLQTLPNRYPAHGSLRFNAKPTERFPYEQCRQPRRGGTGGDGTIRRKRRRRLRWSSPPGQG